MTAKQLERVVTKIEKQQSLDRKNPVDIRTEGNNKYIHEIYQTPEDSLFDEVETREDFTEVP
jgi:hypothetical protein